MDVLRWLWIASCERVADTADSIAWARDAVVSAVAATTQFVADTAAEVS